MLVGLNLNQKTQSLQILYHLFSGFIAVKTGILSAIAVDGSILIKDIDNLKAMAQAHFKVIGVMGRGNLHDAGSEFLFNIGICHNGNLSVHQRQYHRFADEMLIPFILGMDGHGRITQHGLGSGGCNLNILIAVFNRIANMPETAVLFLILNFGIRNGGSAAGTPVDDSLAPVDEPLFIEADKHFQNRLG